MDQLVILFESRFMLTGSATDPRGLDYTANTFEKIIMNGSELPDVKEYYMDYDTKSSSFIDLAVKCTFTYEGGSRIIKDTTWYFEDGRVGVSRQTFSEKF